MKKIVIGIASLLLVCAAWSGPAQACTTHGLVQAATLENMYGGNAALAGFSFTFDDHAYSVVAPDGSTYVVSYVGAGDYITPHLSNIENFIEAHLAVGEVISNTSSTSSQTNNLTSEQCDDYFG